MELRVTKLKLRNVMGIENFELSLGKFTHIKSPNGTGKTSLAKGLESLFDGGANAAKILRNGTEDGEEILEINDGEYGFQKTFTESKTTFKAREKGKISKTSPIELLQSLINKKSANPISFFTATKEERKEILLKAMPIQCDPERMKQITGIDGNFEGNAWDVIKVNRALIYNDRTSTNSAAKERRNTAFQVAQTVPELVENAIDTTALNAEKKAHEDDKDAKLSAIDSKMRWIEQTHSKNAEEIKITFDANAKIISDKIKDLERDLRVSESDRNDKIRENDLMLSENKQKAQNARDARISEYKLSVSEIDAKLREAKLADENEGRIKQSRDLIVLKTKEAEELEETSEIQTLAINNLDAYKIELMSSLPIDGLQIAGDRITHNGIDFDSVNEAKKMEISFEIAMLQCGKVPFMFIDGAERLDAKNFKLFKDRAMQTGAQYLVMSVDHSDDAVGFKTEVF